MVLQFAWWGYHLIELTEELKTEDTVVSKRTLMILSEGLVFFVILLFGLWKIRSSIIKDLKLSQRQTNFLLSVTHELKTPIAANKLYLQTIQKRSLSEEQQKDLIAKAIQENERLELIINNILSASQLENNALNPHKTSTNLNELFDSCIERFHRRYQNNFIVKEFHTNPTVFPVDVFFVETILDNLIENAIKYAGIEHSITLYLDKKEGQCVFGVKDEGPGISIQEQKSIFSKFYRVGNEETRAQKGSGLGLFIVSELVKTHGGKIRYKDNSPKGANFEVTFVA